MPSPIRDGRGPSPVVCVQVMQALVAQELVDRFGRSERQAAALLGLVPSSVSQYRSGKRLGPALTPYLGDPAARRLARGTAQALIEGRDGTRSVLEAATALLGRFEPSAVTADGATGLSAELQRKLPGWLRNRIEGEQNAVTECMRLAQRSRDELTRALFRQIASDSLRHAEIVASIANQLDQGITSSAPTGVTRADVERLIRREHAAEATGGTNLGPELGGMMRVLWESMESDERKHEFLLQMIREAGLSNGPAAPSEGERRGTIPRPPD